MKHLVKFLMIATVLLSITSCEKQNHQKLVGKWKLYIGENANHAEYWNFTETAVSRILEYPSSTVVENDGVYEMTAYNKFIISGANTTTKGVEYFKGEWIIKSIKSNTLILTRSTDGLIYNEFSK